MSAMYRILEQGWTKDEAIKEMVDSGYGFHPIWSNIIKHIGKIDVKKIRCQYINRRRLNNGMQRTCWNNFLTQVMFLGFLLPLQKR
jgi:hypothetical protein